MAGSPKRKQGRPTVRTPEVIARVIEGLSAGTPLTVICSADDMPGIRTVYDWMDADPAFSADIARARDMGWDAIAVDAMAIMDAQPERVVTVTGDDRSESRIDSAAVQWAFRRAELRLKLLAKWDPKRYGDMLKHAGADGGPMAIIVSGEDAGL